MLYYEEGSLSYTNFRHPDNRKVFMLSYYYSLSSPTSKVSMLVWEEAWFDVTSYAYVVPYMFGSELDRR